MDTRPFHTIIIARNFTSAFRDRIVKIDGARELREFETEGYYRRIRENLTIHIFFASSNSSIFFFIDLFTFNVYDRTRESPLL